MQLLDFVFARQPRHVPAPAKGLDEPNAGNQAILPDLECSLLGAQQRGLSGDDSRIGNDSCAMSGLRSSRTDQTLVGGMGTRSGKRLGGIESSTGSVFGSSREMSFYRGQT